MRQIEVKGEVRLVPVIEIEPYHFSSLQSSERTDYFEACMKDAGFTNVVPIAEGWHFVSARSLIGNPILEQLIREAAEGKELDEMGPFYGGLALIADDEAVIGPSCCGDLSDLRSWRQVVAERPPSGRIWIGHPELSFSIHEDRITLVEEWESTTRPDWLVELTMPLAQLSSAVARARAEMKLFRRELEPVVARVLGPSRSSARVTNALIGA